MTLISIVIPTYNHAHFLERALQCIYDQTYNNWEIVLVDNHSEDNTAGVVSRFQDGRIKHLLIRNNGIIAASRNLGIQNASGEWIAFLDSDDYWQPDKLEVVVRNIAADKDCDVFCHDEMMVNIKTGEKKMLHYGPYTADFYQTMLVYGNRLSTSATVVRTSFLTNNTLLFSEDPDLVTVEDYDLWLNLARLGARFLFIPEIKGEYVIHANNSSAQLQRHHNNLINLLKKHTFALQNFEPDKEALWKKVKVRVDIAEIKHAVAGKEYLVSLKKLFRLFVFNPVNCFSFLFSKFK